MPHLVMVIRGFLFLLIFAKKQTNKQTKIRMKIPVFYYFNYYSAAYPSFTNTPGRLQNKP